MTSRSHRVALALAASLIAAACSTQDVAQLRCQLPDDSPITDLLGEAELETFSVDRLDECVWTSQSTPADTITVRIEDAPDGALFIEHAIEATSSDRVVPLDISNEALSGDAVLFEDEAVLGRSGNQIALITSSMDTNLLVPVLEASLARLDP